MLPPLRLLLHCLRLTITYCHKTAWRISTSAAQLKSLKQLDRSKVPELRDDELEVRCVRGSGPGGQATNKTNNQVVMKHLPTGIVVKCHETRSQDQNWKLAREHLIERLDLLYNGENAIVNQKKRIIDKQRLERQRRQKKRNALKLAFKEGEKSDPS